MAAVSIRNSTLFADANLVSYWEFEGNSNDSKGSNNGTDTSITYNSGNGKFSQGAGFVSATPSKIVLADAASLKPTTNFTIMAWFKSTTAANQRVFASQNDVTNFAGISLFVGSGGDLWLFSAKNTGTIQGTDYELMTSPGTTLLDGAYHFIVGTWDGTKLHTYIDGSESGTGQNWSYAAAYQGTNYPRIGILTVSGGDSQGVDGALDEVALFSRALSSTEISNHYSGVDVLVASGNMLNFFMP